MKKIRPLLTFLIIAFLSCGDDKKEEEKITIGEDNTLETMKTEKGISKTDTTSKTTNAVINRDGVVEVILTGNDQMKYNLNEIRVKAGQKVKLTLKHIGQLDKNVMGHNFVLLKPGTDIPKFAQRASDAADNDYIPKDTKQVFVYTKMLGGGEVTSIEFEAPEAGTYDFICSFPGHYVQMKGKFIVE